MKQPLLVLVGPTAVGKTAISVAVARAVGGEIISGDSMQVYRNMNIGTAKISPAQMQGVPHHLIDIVDPDHEFSVAQFQRQVHQLIGQIRNRGRLPILVGGTGLYIRSILMAYSFTPQESDPSLRDQLARQEERLGPGYLHRQLELVDPEAARRLHPNDRRRIIRALEVYQLTGSPISSTQNAWEQERRYDDLMIGLTMERDALNRRIDERVEQMLSEGLEQEAMALLRSYGPHITALQGLGYRELLLCFRGLLTRSEAISLIKRNTRRFAKRQLTWFRREPQLIWLDLSAEMDRAGAVAQIVRLAEGKWSREVEADSQ